MVRLQPSLLSGLDNWIAQQAGSPSRPEAIRRLLERAFAGKGGKPPPSKKAARKAEQMAARELEKLGSQSEAGTDLQQRKRTLIRGPKEFREIRADLPKPKS
jgi:hypothetical protein